MCSKPAPFGYSITLTTAHLIAAPIYAMAFYTLHAEKSSNFKVYKRYLAIHAVSNFIFELHLSVVMKPVLYLPNPIKFASIIETSRWLLIVLTVLTVCSLALCVVGLFDQTMHKLKLQALDYYPEILCMSALVLPNSSSTGLKPIHFFNLSALLSIFVGCFLCASMGVVSLLALREMLHQTRTSLRTIAMHKAFLFSLFCQISVHGAMLGFPMCIYIVSVVFNFDGNDVGYVAIVLASMHGAMSTLAMIAFNRPLYELAISRVLSMFTSNNVVCQRLLPEPPFFWPSIQHKMYVLRAALLSLLLTSAIVQVEGNWLRQRNVQWHGSLDELPNHQMRNTKKTFLPPRYQNLWGQGESSKVVSSSALAPQNMDDYKMQTQQRQVFSWQPNNALEW
ncbi:unnamed protein product [Caenorhabditis sp. 36 PRJEB53466]|nr:unnamed protein product [Caenorhabditis sp. 36 PRJEB53466]